MSPRFGTPESAARYKFDYLGRIHYNGDGYMLQHLYDVVKGGMTPRTTIEQAYLAEAVGYCAVQSARKGAVVRVRDIIPDDLSGVWDEDIFPE